MVYAHSVLGIRGYHGVTKKSRYAECYVLIKNATELYSLGGHIVNISMLVVSSISPYTILCGFIYLPTSFSR